jgi:hypothetical protein
MNLYPKVDLNALNVLEPELDVRQKRKNRHSIDSSSLASDTTWRIPIDDISERYDESVPCYDYNVEELLRNEAGNFHILYRNIQDGRAIKVVRRREYNPITIEEIKKIQLASILQPQNDEKLATKNASKPENIQKVKLAVESDKDRIVTNSSVISKPQTISSSSHLNRASSEKLFQKTRSISPSTLKNSKFSSANLSKLQEIKSLNLERIIYADYSKQFHWKADNIRPRTFKELRSLLTSIHIASNPKSKSSGNLPSRSRQRFKSSQQIEPDSLRQEIPSYATIIKKCEAVKRSISPLIRNRNNPLFRLSRTSKLLQSLASYPDLSRSKFLTERSDLYKDRRFKWQRNASKLAESNI